MADNHLESFIKLLSKVPGLGPRSARRAALHMIKNKEATMKPLSELMNKCYETVQTCSICRNVDTEVICSICRSEKRDQTILCIVEEVGDLWAIERSQIYKGLYHVLGGNLSAIDGIGPEELGISKLLKRIQEKEITEIIIATNATIEGQTTAHFISEQIKPLNIKVSRIAYGIPVGGELDYLDDGTLNAAFRARAVF